jgi:hypothetical protein
MFNPVSTPSCLTKLSISLVVLSRKRFQTNIENMINVSYYNCFFWSRNRNFYSCMIRVSVPWTPVLAFLVTWFPTSWCATLVTKLCIFTCSSASLGFRSSCRLPCSNKHQLSCSVCLFHISSQLQIDMKSRYFGNWEPLLFQVKRKRTEPLAAGPPLLGSLRPRQLPT